ncbi:MAG TPA: 16S rRNA (guanine(966)-N(2))-methyltransferase RsmD [Candidatus Competibacteraceae bacterium]|nr:16S rRNA (guanine(966)-N(2))-methyltransferase RsmD [Candidatus Competibacteraceae bacterium]
MSAKRSGASNQVRIIAGRWRGRRLPFPDVAGLRPTPDRVRETLFNWLAPVIQGARCLDLFAGSGALGLEALSRDAAEVLFVERDPRAAAQLRANLERLGVPPQRWRLYTGDALALLHQPAEPFDIVFLDPPFGQGLLDAASQALLAGGWLKPDGWLYLEGEAGFTVRVSEGWRLWREGRAGQVDYRLLRGFGGPAA